MTYDTKNRILHTGVYEKVKLTKLEHKFLICLSSGNITTYNEMRRYLFTEKNSICVLRLALERKTNFELRISTVRNVGYRLENEIYFE